MQVTLTHQMLALSRYETPATVILDVNLELGFQAEKGLMGGAAYCPWGHLCVRRRP
jgi:hypothetical protein